MRKSRGMAYIAILIILVVTTVSFGADISELESKRDEINIQKEETNNQITEIQSQLSETLQEIQELTEKIEGYEQEISQLLEDEEKLKNDIEDLEEKLEISEHNYNKQKKLLEDRLVALYEAGETSYLDVLLDSKSISDFISNYYLISEIAKCDTELLTDMEQEKIKIQNNKEQLEEKKETLKKARIDKEKTNIVLENTMVLRNNYLSQLTEEEKQLQEKINIYNEELKKVESDILLLTSVNLSEEYIGGLMSWPVPGYSRITSPFAMRVHPITHVYKLHTGIDIGAPEGANFIAVTDGLVIKAGWSAAYGNMVIIDHGGGVTTLYAHGSKIMVEVGDLVSRGDIVLKVGSTGYSTGPHAHFEVRIDGKYVQPLNFLEKK